MNDHARTPYEIDEAIRTSTWMRVINREHSRSFSLNILRTNARELLEALRHVSDPDHGLRLMAQDNRVAGTQAHREVARRIHNFVASAKTLVDHTRVFMEEHYDKTSIWPTFNREIEKRFSNNQLVKFVHDLRNYMVHRGLPNSEMFIQYSKNPEHPDDIAQITTGVQINTEKLMEWDRWTVLARSYIDKLEGKLPIKEIVIEYVSQIEAFEKWLGEQIAGFHSADILQFESLQEEYALSESKFEHSSDDKEIEEPVTHDFANMDKDLFSFPSQITIEIDRLGDQLLVSICELKFAPTEQEEFKSDRHIHAKITPDRIIGQPILRLDDVNGNQVLAFIVKRSAIYGFDSESLITFRQLTNLVLNIQWAQRNLTEKFIENTIINWCRLPLGSGKKVKLSKAIKNASRKNVKSVEVWAPIAHLEIESGFSFGPVQILPITAKMINRLEAQGLKNAPSQGADIREMFKGLRTTIQGYAAIVVKLDAVSERAGLDGLTIAREALNLLRFFSPAASEATILCPTSLLGSDVVPKSHVLVLGKGSFSYRMDIVSTDVAYWRMSKARVAELRKPLEVTGSLVQTENLNDFERAVRSGMILFATAATFVEPSDRLVYTLSAMESVLLKHELEAAAYSVEERMAQLLAKENVESDEIASNIRAIYRLRARHGSLQWSDRDRDVLQKFVYHARRVLMLALQNVAIFDTRAEFIEAVERRAHG
jgi:hypothetical protein